MTPKWGPLGFRGDDRYRNVPEKLIVEMVMLAGWACEIDSSGVEAAAREALQTWTRIGLIFRRAPNGERLFDPIEVNNFMKRAGHEGRDGYWSQRFVATRRQLILDSPGDAEGRFTVEFKRSFHLQSIPAGRKLRLRMPLPIAGDYLKDIRVTPCADTVQDAQINLSPGRLEARLVASGQAEAIFGATLSFTAGLQEPRVDQASSAPDETLYLGEREGLIVVSKRIRALAQFLAGQDAPPLDAIRAFWEYINHEMICGSLHYDQLDLDSPCDSILDTGFFDCQMGSALFVALCRAHGIPARLAGGYLLYQPAPTNHYWAEAWIKDRGWMPFDFLSRDLSEGGRDLAWRDRFFGRLDYRLTSERLPREFMGSPGIPIPAEWWILQVARPGGVEIGFMDVKGTRVYADTVSVTGWTRA